MKFIIHRGSQEIGGSCVEVTAGNTRIILDVGLPLDYTGDPKGSKPARNHFPSSAAHVPKVAGLFQAGPSVGAILISSSAPPLLHSPFPPCFTSPISPPPHTFPFCVLTHPAIQCLSNVVTRGAWGLGRWFRLSGEGSGGYLADALRMVRKHTHAAPATARFIYVYSFFFSQRAVGLTQPCSWGLHPQEPMR